MSYKQERLAMDYKEATHCQQGCVQDHKGKTVADVRASMFTTVINDLSSFPFRI